MSILFNKAPLTINTELAKLIGLNEAIIIQQIHFWLKEEKNLIDGKYWVYNSIPQWKKQFSFFSESTIKRTFKSLKDLGLLFVGEYNKDKRDKTNWYSINYERLNEIVNDASGQNELMEEVKMNLCNGSKWTDSSGQNEPTITKDYPKITTKTTTNNISDKSPKLKKSCQLPNDFVPKETHYVLAKKLGVHLDNEFEHFRDHHLARGSTMKDWNAALNTWLRNAAKFNKQKSGYKTRSERNMELLNSKSTGLSIFDDVIDQVPF